jgi:hypothetical protein
MDAPERGVMGSRVVAVGAAAATIPARGGAPESDCRGSLGVSRHEESVPGVFGRSALGFGRSVGGHSGGGSGSAELKMPYKIPKIRA